MKNFLLYLSLFLIIILATLHLIAVDNFFYWIFPWFDILMHFLGGSWVAITAIWLFKEKLYFPNKIFWISFLSVLIISLFWEIFELIIWESLREPGYLFDTILDTVMALLGSTLISLLLRNFYNEKI